MTGVGHRVGAFNLPKKKHNPGRHRTKGEINRAQTGKVDVITASRKHKALIGRAQRRLIARDNRIAHRNNVLAEKRLKGIKCPAIITVVSFDFDHKVSDFFEVITSHEDIENKLNAPKTILYTKLKRFQNAQLGFLSPSYDDIGAVFNALKISDLLMVIWPNNGQISGTQQEFIRQVKAFGSPSVLHFTMAGGSQKEKSQNKKDLEKVISDWAFGEDKFHYLDFNDIHNCLRTLKDSKKIPLSIQSKRSYLVADDISVIGNVDDYVTAIKCVVRGAPLNPNRLLTLQGIGNFQIKKIIETDPLWSNKDVGFNMEPAPGKKAWSPDPEKQETLVDSIIPDPMDAEQTWPTKDDYEMSGINENVINEIEKKVSVKVPKGTSEYQAAWYVDDNDEEENCGDEEDADDEEMENEGEWDAEDVSEDEDRKTIADDNATIMMDDNDMEDDEEAYDIYKDARENAKFPDEIETPKDIPARERFQKYRGLKSFKNAKWDPKENLPYDYARIFKISNYPYTKKVITKEIEEEFENEYIAAPVGTTVIIILQNAPIELFEKFTQGYPLVMYQLLRHEQKMSILNIVLKRIPGCEDIIKNKAELIFQVGFRRFSAEPIFSQHTNGDKFKMERFMPENGPFVATIYAPITFPPCPVLAYRRNEFGRDVLVATGSILDLNPDRIILKRTVISGHPFKINKRSVVCRYMFFNKEDIEYFKPLELWSPSGARGHIKESLGTHGLFKCTFDKQLSAMDVILLNLYKRVYPKWTTNSFA
uniref:Pre-rRNA-processing protein TSR1 homolog n=1 Tax=Parastrongyloides trichosuri TaxID=131310 RepID=A0A0N4ZFE2_PARTI